VSPTADPDAVDLSPTALAFEVPNVGPGPDPLTLAALAAEHDFVVLLLQRDHYCTNCREQVQTVGKRYADFRERDAEVVSVLPEPVERAREWQRQYDLPYPLVADPDAAVGEAYDQPVRFGPLGRLHDFFGRQPEAVVIDLREGADAAAVVYVHRGRTTFDRPTVEELLAAIDETGD
jgi:peroxiredoxin Q/BCP